MIFGIMLFLLVAAVDWLAVARGWKRLEYIAKPAAMLVLLGMLGFLMLVKGSASLPLICFSLGIFLSMVGDIFLMISYARFSDRWFLTSLAAFLPAHLAYIIGLNIPLPNVSPLWSMGLAVVLALTAARLLRRIIAGVRQKGLRRLVFPVEIYGMIITLMLLSALLTISSPNWNVAASALVALGAVLFYLSDTLLAWGKFVSPIRNGRLVDMILYHLGQLALVIGVILQFGNLIS